MEVKLKETSVDCFDEVFSQTLRKEDSQDCVVPDTMPDIGSVLSCCGEALIRGKDVSEGRVRIEANIPARVLYLPEEGEGIEGLDVNLPLYFSVDSPEITDECRCVVRLNVAALEAKTLNPRKIAVRAETALELRCYAPASLRSVSAPEEGTEGVSLLEREVTVSPVLAAVEKTFVLTDELPAAELPAGARILSRSLSLNTAETRSTGTKLILKGEARSSLLLAGSGGELHTMEFETSFSQIVECAALPEECHPVISLLASGIYYELGGEGTPGTMELHLVAQAVVYGDVTKRCVADAYSNRYPMEVRRETEKLSRIRGCAVLRDTLRGSIPTPEPAAEILRRTAVLGQAQAEGDGISVPVTVELCCRGQEGNVFFARRSFVQRLSHPLQEGQSLLPAEAEAQELQLTQTAGDVDVRLTLEARALLWETGETERITLLTADEGETLDLSEMPALVLLHASDGDDLWALAKHFHSTVESIAECNGLDALTPGWEKLLLIPKTV